MSEVLRLTDAKIFAIGTFSICYGVLSKVMFKDHLPQIRGEIQ